jgi:hypothetical protein
MKSILNKILVFSAIFFSTILIYWFFNFEIAMIVILSEIATSTYIRNI